MNSFIFAAHLKNLLYLETDVYEEFLLLDDSYPNFLDIMFNENNENTYSEITKIESESGLYLLDEFKNLLITE